MSKKFILIDFENVPNQVEVSTHIKEYDIWVFVGKNQVISKPKMLLGANVIRYENSGKNSNDFMITYHIGQLHCIYGDQPIYIISKDKGFDSTVENLKSIGFVHVKRVESIKSIPVQKESENV